jgi:hypothetical protein
VLSEALSGAAGGGLRGVLAALTTTDAFLYRGTRPGGAP